MGIICATETLTLRLDVDIGGWNSELELTPTNASVWMSNELGNGITSKYRAAFDSLARASSRFRPLPPRYREAFACRLPSSFVSSKKKKPHPRAQGQGAGEACAQDPAAGEARARLGGRTTGGGPLHLHGRARAGRAFPPPLSSPPHLSFHPLKKSKSNITNTKIVQPWSSSSTMLQSRLPLSA